METKKLPYLGQMLYYYPGISDRTCRISNTSINAALVIGFPDLLETPDIVALKIFTNGEPIVRKDNVRQQTGHETGTWSFREDMGKAEPVKEEVKTEPAVATEPAATVESAPVTDEAPVTETPAVAETTTEPAITTEPVAPVENTASTEPPPAPVIVGHEEFPVPASVVDAQEESQPEENLAEELDKYAGKADEAIESTDETAAPTPVGESTNEVDQGTAEASAEVVGVQPSAVEEEKVSDLQVNNPFLHDEVDKTEEQVDPPPPEHQG